VISAYSLHALSGCVWLTSFAGVVASLKAQQDRLHKSRQTQPQQPLMPFDAAVQLPSAPGAADGAVVELAHRAPHEFLGCTVSVDFPEVRGTWRMRAHDVQ
jgi:hypothetical protein